MINGLKYLDIVVNSGVDALRYVTNVYAGGSQLVRVVRHNAIFGARYVEGLILPQKCKHLLPKHMTRTSANITYVSPEPCTTFPAAVGPSLSASPGLSVENRRFVFKIKKIGHRYL